jgi:two-component system, chemotaxis family, protein-glutamate methylesterase/glutaminase
MPKSLNIADPQAAPGSGSNPNLHEADKLRLLRQSQRAIVIGASTGGPQAVPIVLKGLTPAIQQMPVFVVLHIPPQFTETIAEHIQRATGLPTHTARHGEQVLNGHIYISPGNLHLSVARLGEVAVIVLSDAPPENFCKPSVDVLFRAAAHVYGAQTTGIILTGMGSDGLAGSRTIVEAGGLVVAQDAASSAVWGMPRSVVREGLAHAVLSLDSMGPTICRLLRQRVFREKLS